MGMDIGYAAGTTDSGQWLTVWGSAHRDDLIYPTQAEAEARADVLRAGSVPAQAARVIVCKVENLSGIYVRILGVVGQAAPEPCDAAGRT